jgi:hypothetical protein
MFSILNSDCGLEGNNKAQLPERRVEEVGGGVSRLNCAFDIGSDGSGFPGGPLTFL